MADQPEFPDQDWPEQNGLELRLDTTAEAVDWVRSLLTPQQYSGEIYLEPFTTSEPRSVTNTPPWTYTLRLYLPNTRMGRSHLSAIEKLLSPLERTGLTGELQVSTGPGPVVGKGVECPIGTQFLILPASSPTPHSDRIPLYIPSSLAFGSGLHPATGLCLELLERWVKPGMHVLDLGSGSGILSVAMAKLGATVTAIDNDPVAAEATQATVDLNQVSAQVTVFHGSLGRGGDLGHWLGDDPSAGAPVQSSTAQTLQPQADFDLIAANILGRIHITLAPDFGAALRPGGLLITAGFTMDYADGVSEALQEVGFEEADRATTADWIALAYHLI
jgi:ribosomal protein L11 methyltransferase